ncbi:MAG: MotA/TolQ/ExbB proton channel family protein [Pseudomonadota bacterium]
MTVTAEAVTAARRVLAIRASLFALVAGVLVAFSLATGAANPSLATVLALAAAAAPLAVLFASRGLALLSLASGLLLLLVGLFALTPFVDGGLDVAAFGRFAPWPLIVVGFAVGRALDDLAALAETRPARDPAWCAHVIASGDTERIGRTLGACAAYTVGVAVLVLCLAFAVGDAAWLVKTPVHGALVVLASLCAVLLVAALSEPRPRPGAPLGEAFDVAAAGRRRYLRTLIALLPVLGFVGTVLGLQRALSQLPEGFSESFAAAGPDSAFTASLVGIATAFETTLIGLVGSFVFQFILAGVERAEAARLADHLVDHANG